MYIQPNHHNFSNVYKISQLYYTTKPVEVFFGSVAW